jgi:hypothetical protein
MFDFCLRVRQFNFAIMKKDTSSDSQERRSRVSQSDVPAYPLDAALSVAKAIAENYAFSSVKPLQLAAALSISPTSSTFRMLCGTSIAYGLTEGGYNAAEIIPTELARRILKPTVEGDDLAAKREAFLKPRVPREFLTKYNGNRLPRQDIALNVLEHMGVPDDSTQRTLDLIIEGAKSLGLFTDIKSQLYVDLHGVKPLSKTDEEINPSEESGSAEEVSAPPLHSINPPVNLPPAGQTKLENRRVFISHGKNRAFVDSLKELLSFGELEPLVATENESVSQPVPDKVMSDMRRCSAAIIHVDSEQRLITQEGEQKTALNPNVLIEIGAAMALYGRRFILLVRDGTGLPSNLQGLYEVRYQGDKLDADVTIKLLKAIRDIKNHPLP